MDNQKTPLSQQALILKNSGLNPTQVVKELQATNRKQPLGAKTAMAVSNAMMSTFAGLTPLELAQLLKLYNDDPVFVAQGVLAPEGFPNTTALEMGRLLLDSSLFPTLSKTDMQTTLTKAGYSTADATAAVNTIYGAPASFALAINGTPSFLAAPPNSAYNFGTGDFTLQAWVKTTASGTVISRKGGPGGPGNGGFLLVIKSNGIIKLATDNGFGFFEINTNAPTVIRDGNWHFITGVRQSGQLTIYVDGNSIPSTPGSNINPPINVNNSLPLVIGSTDQWQEQFRQFTGSMDEVRIWNIALSQATIRAQMNAPLSGNESGLIGYYTFSGQNGNDRSPLRNNANPTGGITYISPGVF